MKVLVSIVDAVKVKRGGKSELYIVAGVADKNPANDDAAPLNIGGTVATDGGVQIITSAVYTGVKQGGSLNLAGIGIPLYYGEPGGALAVSYRFMESDSKERALAKSATELLSGARVKSIVAAAAAAVPPLLGSVIDLAFQEIPSILQKNGDDDFGGGAYNSVAPSYDFKPGETVKYYDVSTNEMRAKLRVELIQDEVEAA